MLHSATDTYPHIAAPNRTRDQAHHRSTRVTEFPTTVDITADGGHAPVFREKTP